MKKNILLFIFVINLTLLTSFIQNKDLDQSVVIIVNKENPIEKLSVSEIKLYWLRKVKKRWTELNKNIKPVDRKGKSSEQEAFYKKVLKMSAIDVESYFSQKQYESAEKPQDKFSSDKDIIDFVSEQEGAIGFINSNSVNSEIKSKVKIVATIN
ncbi:MAG: hypothetical protein EAZ27_07425 [Cytophagales bacterium]|nr:MAG: hypothetical protein EAZ27_07425 [Cytophagales bacterium]